MDSLQFSGLRSTIRQPALLRLDGHQLTRLDGDQGTDPPVWRSLQRSSAVQCCPVLLSSTPNRQENRMRSDIDIKRDVEAELHSNPDIDATDIAVAVKNGAVALTGYVRSYMQKLEAEKTAKRVSGVVAVANDIEVRLPIFNQRSDPEIARDAVAAIQNRLHSSSDHIRLVVRDGWVTLEGSIEWNYQHERAEEAVRCLRGVKGVTNLIQLHARIPPSESKRKIEEAFRRSAELDANRITVDAEGGTVVLRGSVRSWAEKEGAESDSWSTLGVVRVDNQLIVSP